MCDCECASVDEEHVPGLSKAGVCAHIPIRGDGTGRPETLSWHSLAHQTDILLSGTNNTYEHAGREA